MRDYDTELASGKRDFEQPNDGGPAFGHGNPEQGGDPGMSLRDWFAGQAIAGLLANEDAVGDIQITARQDGVAYPEMAASIAFNIADAMLAHRTGEGQ